MQPTAALAHLLTTARTLGATDVETLYAQSIDLSVSVRLGQPETLERSENSAIGIRVFVGKRQAFASTSDLSAAALETLAERAVAMAKLAPEDAYARSATPQEYATTHPELDLFDPEEPSAESLITRAREAEATARAHPAITNSEGGDAGWGQRRRHFLTSQGFEGGYASSSHSLSTSVIAGTGAHMQRDYAYTMARHASNLKSPEWVGTEAASRTARRLNPRKLSTRATSILFEPRVGRSLLSAFASAINGASVARGTSFLKEAMGEQIFSDSISVIDNPTLIRGLASSPFDGEGLANQPMAMVENGILKSWFLDIATAAQLGLTSTGHASRGLSSPPSPSPSNLHLTPGTRSPEEMIQNLKEGLLVTETFGMGVNLVTGDYSQGAAGFWIENGEIAYPVEEITIAGHLRDMFRTLEAANDLSFDYTTNTPTLLIPTMTVAGS